jgi:hypothetical protein
MPGSAEVASALDTAARATGISDGGAGAQSVLLTAVDACLPERVEQRRLADVRHADDEHVQLGRGRVLLRDAYVGR